MPYSVDELEAQVLGLSPVERAHLLDRLIESFEPTTEVQSAWVAEAARRETEVQSGGSTLVPGAQTIDRIRKQIS